MNTRAARAQNRSFMVLLGMLLASAPASSQDFDPGRALYENHCQQCHADRIHFREKSRITGLDDLRATVGAWSMHAGLSWRHEEIEAVTRYVNRRFYQITGQGPPAGLNRNSAPGPGSANGE